MKVIYCTVFIAMVLLLSGIVSASSIATVHGVAYEWSTFEPLDNAIIEVNSTPAQSMVAKYGVYSFELTNGTYQITASYYEDEQLTYYAEDVIKVSDEGSYVLDLLLLPSYSGSENSDTSAQQVETNSTGTNNSSLISGSIIVVIVLLILLIYQMKQQPKKPQIQKQIKFKAHRSTASNAGGAVIENSGSGTEDPVQDKEKTTNEPEEKAVTSKKADNPIQEPVIPPDEPVPSDLQEILDILKSQGGRMTQKDMRKRLKYSEGKVSLMLLDLEKRGKIRKFKKGRGNVLFLVESEK